MLDQNELSVATIKKALAEINNEMQLHEGAAAFVAFKDGTVFLELQGACAECFSAGCGFLANLEHKLKTAIPVVKKIVVL